MRQARPRGNFRASNVLPLGEVPVRLRLPTWVRLGSDETLALVLAATLCASGPGVLVGADVPPPRFLAPETLALLGLVVVLAVAAQRVRGAGALGARAAGAALFLVAASAGAAWLIDRRADAWFAEEPLYEATVLMLGAHLAGIGAAQLGPRIPARVMGAHARAADLGAAAQRLARALVRAALGWLALFWALVTLGLLYASAVTLLLAVGCVVATLPLRLLVGATGSVEPARRLARRRRKEVDRDAARA